MVKYSLILSVVLLQGCLYQTVDSFDIYKATQYCGSIEKVVKISSNVFGEEWATCKNGKGYPLHRFPRGLEDYTNYAK